MDLAADLTRASGAGAAIAERLHAGGDGDAYRQRRLLAADLADLVLALPAPAPMLVALEDLHWADDLTLDVLERVARRLPDVPLLIVGTYRSDELYPRVPARAWRTRLLTQRLAEEVRLPRLAADRDRRDGRADRRRHAARGPGHGRAHPQRRHPAARRGVPAAGLRGARGARHPRRRRPRPGRGPVAGRRHPRRCRVGDRPLVRRRPAHRDHRRATGRGRRRVAGTDGPVLRPAATARRRVRLPAQPDPEALYADPAPTAPPGPARPHRRGRRRGRVRRRVRQRSLRTRRPARRRAPARAAGRRGRRGPVRPPRGRRAAAAGAAHRPLRHHRRGPRRPARRPRRGARRDRRQRRRRGRLRRGGRGAQSSRRRRRRRRAHPAAGRRPARPRRLLRRTGPASAGRPRRRAIHSGHRRRPGAAPRRPVGDAHARPLPRRVDRVRPAGPRPRRATSPPASTPTPPSAPRSSSAAPWTRAGG